MASSEAGRVEELLQRITESWRKNQSTSRKAVEESVSYVYDSLTEHRLITALNDPQPRIMLQQVLNCFELSATTPDKLEDVCQKFLSSLLSPGRPTLTDLARKFRKEWNSEAVQIGLPASFLSKETLKREEYQILESNMMSMEREKNRSQSSTKPHGPRRLNSPDINNLHALIFEKYFPIIVEVLLKNDLSVPFVNTLCKATFIRPAVKDQVLKIDNRFIQANKIVRSVHVLIARGIVPKIILMRFINVLNLPEFLKFFEDHHQVVSSLNREVKGYDYSRPISTPKLITDRNSLKIMTKGKESEFPLPLRDLNPSELPSDKYQRHLYIKYKRLNPISLCSPRMKHHQWKYFDLAANEKCLMTSEGSLDLHCIPQTNEYPPRTLILGAPGVGKSSIAVELCRRWYNGDLLSQYQYVILLQADDPKINQAKDLKDLFPNQKWMDPIQEVNGSNSLFIIDGYSELSDESRKPYSLYDRLIKGDVLAEASLIVTSRPWCAYQLSEYFPNEVEILGFTTKSCEDYIKYFFEGDAAEFLDRQKHVMEMCRRVPLYLSIIIKICNEYKQNKPESQFPTTSTMSTLYGLLIRTLILRFVKNSQQLSKFVHDDCPPEIAPGEFISFPRYVYLPFLKLCMLAYESLFSSKALNLEHDHITFDLLNDLHDNNDQLTSLSPQSYYTFLHPSIQEYLAAYCISRMKEEDIRKHLLIMIKNYRYQLVLQFLYGFGVIPTDFNRYPVSDKEIVIHNFAIFRQLCEANSKDLVKSNFQRKLCIIRRTNPLPSPFDFLCLGKVIALSDKCEWELGFTHRLLQNDHLRCLLEGIESVKNSNSRIKKIGLGLTMVDEMALNYFFTGRNVCILSISELFLNGIGLKDSIIPILCKAVSRLNHLKLFLFHHNDITPGHHMGLISALAANRSLEQVSFTDLLPKECTLLVQSLKRLKVIELWRLQTRSCEAFFNALHNNKTVSELEIYDCEITHACAQLLPSMLPTSKIVHLKLSNCGINNLISKQIVLAATKHESLESLNLSDNVISEGEDLLELCSERYINLKEMYTSNNFSEHLIRRFREAEWKTM